MVQHIYVVRHGDTALNEKRVIRGWKDVLLSTKGIRSAKDVAEKLAKEPVDLIVGNDLTRVLDTCYYIKDATGKPIIWTPKKLRTWNLGIYTGQPSDTADKDIKEYILKYPDKTIPEGESFNDYKKRLLDALLEILGKHKDKNFVIVNHHSGLAVLDAWIADGADENYKIDLELAAKRMVTDKVKPGHFEHYHGIWSRKQNKLL